MHIRIYFSLVWFIFLGHEIPNIWCSHFQIWWHQFLDPSYQLRKILDVTCCLGFIFRIKENFSQNWSKVRSSTIVVLGMSRLYNVKDLNIYHSLRLVLNLELGNSLVDMLGNRFQNLYLLIMHYYFYFNNYILLIILSPGFSMSCNIILMSCDWVFWFMID